MRAVPINLLEEILTHSTSPTNPPHIKNEEDHPKKVYVSRGNRLKKDSSPDRRKEMIGSGSFCLDLLGSCV